MIARPRIRGVAVGVGIWLSAHPSSAVACSACFGDPDSAMARGVVAGVVVLVGIVSCVLAGVAGTGLYWIHRSRRLTTGSAAARLSDR